MLARDIYRDIYLDAGPSFEQRMLLAAKRLGMLFAGGALVLGVLDLSGVHSFDGATAFLHSAPQRLASLGESLRSGVSQISIDPSAARSNVAPARIAVALPAQQSLSPKPAASPVDELAATRRQNAVTLAMTAPAFNDGSASMLDVFKSAPAQTAPMLDLGAPTAPMAALERPLTLPDAAASAQASVPPDAQLQLASLSSQIDAPAAPSTLMLPVPKISAAPIGIPLTNVPLPRAAPALSPADRLGLKDKDYSRAERCLANAVYFEARSEPVRGQMAVAQVVLNRVFSGFYPNDICGVVYQNANRHLACQFTFACDGKRKVIDERASWAVANRIAKQTLDGQIYVPEVAKSTHYHADYVHPSWVHEMKRLVRFGIHSFYRPYAWGNGAEEPVWGSGPDASRRTKTAAR